MPANQTRCQSMHDDPSNWTLGTIYHCKDDPRVIVRNRLPFGWTWNFGHPRVWPALLLTVFGFFTPVVLARQVGVLSPFVLGAILLATLGVIVWIASRIARDPDA